MPKVLAKLVSTTANATTQQTTATPRTGAQGQPLAAVESSASTMPKLVMQQVITILQQAPAGMAKLPAEMANELQGMIQQPDLPAAVKTQFATANQVTGDTVKQAIQSVLAKLGVSYEAGLIARDPQIQYTLKTQLVALMQEGIAGQHYGMLQDQLFKIERAAASII